ncbi:MAG TPA: shikimate kinase [Tepidisphaeraceae bacterium]|nr:shikimate kinase [Tepidisphaeraceae bacterium]
MSVILVGYRGSGKTTVGRKLAQSLWLKFVDVDDLIVDAAKKTIRDIFEQDGESRFRDLETQAVTKALTLADHIIAMGGGAILRDENRRLIKDSKMKCIYLRCDPQVLLQRIQGDPLTAANRPNLTGFAGGIDEIRTLLAQREALYREVMTAELDVTHLGVDEAVTYVTRMM